MRTRRQFSFFLIALLAPVAKAQSAIASWPAGVLTPQLQAQDTQGKTWRLSQLQGRPVVVLFWASWCEVCRAELPTLQKLADSRGSLGLQILTVNVKESATLAAQYAQSTGLKLPVLLDPQGQLAKQWGAKVFPCAVLIDSKGRARQRVVGEIDWTGIKAAQLIATLG